MARRITYQTEIIFEPEKEKEADSGDVVLKLFLCIMLIMISPIIIIGIVIVLVGYGIYLLVNKVLEDAKQWDEELKSNKKLNSDKETTVVGTLEDTTTGSVHSDG